MHKMKYGISMSMDNFLDLCFDFKGYITLSTILELIKAC